MGWLPEFEYDLFVSYAHIDDEPNVGQPYGWVTVLKDNLKKALDRRLGTKSNIWMDQRLVSQARLSAPIVDGLRQAAGLLVIASRAYLKSYWCGRERGGFLDGLQDRRTAQRPIFIVECDDLDGASLPEAFGDCIPVKFWQRENDGAAPQRLGDPLPGSEDRTYWARLNDLSFKIAEELGRLQNAQERAKSAQGKGGQAIFLAEVTDDLLDDNERVQRSLQQAGLLVLPNRTYPRDTSEAFAGAMLDDLGRCKVFVQLLGEYAGRVRGWSKSLAALQYETAQRAGVLVRHRRRFELGEVKDDDHRGLVFGPNVVNESLEVFIGDVAKVAMQEEEADAPRCDGDEMLVFVDHDKDDANTAADLCQFFDRQGLGYMTPDQHDTADAMRAELEENLKLCDGLVLVYGRSQTTWVRHQLKEAIKIKGVRQRPLAHVVLCHGEPDNDKADPGIKLPNQRVIDCRHGLDTSAQRALTEFVKSLRGVAR